MPSIQKMYTYCIWAGSVAFGLLVWNFVSFTNNMTNGRIGKETALAAGIESDIASFTGEYNGYVINDIHTSFIHLSGGLFVALTWTLLIALAGMSIRAILSKDWRFVLIPGAVFLISNIILGARTFDISENLFTTNMMATVSVITGIGVVGALLNARYNVEQSRPVPDSLPESMSAQHTSSAGG